MTCRCFELYNLSKVMDKPRRFVIQRHERQGEPVHWDLMLEAGDCLETYRVGVPPERWGNEPIEAVKIFDHPLRFLTYEGSVNEGKGQVKIADKGTYRVVKQSESQLTLDFTGTILKEEFTFIIPPSKQKS
jgi:bifunctional non-homologous end joining protein LigD